MLTEQSNSSALAADLGDVGFLPVEGSLYAYLKHNM